MNLSTNLLKNIRNTAIVIGLACILSGCVGGALWTGASLVYDRHSVYKTLSDYQLNAAVGRALFSDTMFKCKNCAITVSVFKGVILLAGHVPSRDLREEADARVARLKGYAHLSNQLTVKDTPSNGLHDSWITTKIRSKITADSTIDPNSVKITTADGIVYILGEMKVDEAKKVILYARKTAGVQRVVTLLKYFSYVER